MECFESPFLTYTNSPNDPGYMGEEAELAALHLRTEALDHALKTGRDFDVVLDMLAEHGQDPIAYVEEVGEQVELIIASHIVPPDWAVWQGLY